MCAGQGQERARSGYLVEADRRAAIELAAVAAEGGRRDPRRRQGPRGLPDHRDREAARSTTVAEARAAAGARPGRLTAPPMAADGRPVLRRPGASQATGARRTRSGALRRSTAVCTDTRTLTPGALFVALRGRAVRRPRLPRPGRGGAAPPGRWCSRAQHPRRRRPTGSRSTRSPDTLAALGGAGAVPPPALHASRWARWAAPTARPPPRRWWRAILADPRASAEDRGQPQQRGRRAADALRPASPSTWRR